MEKTQLTVDEVQELLGISKSQAYKIIRSLNSELKEKGYYIVRGKVSTKYFKERFYGYVVG